MRIIFIVPQLSQPRCIKRVQNFIDAGFNVDVYGFDNGLYSDNIKDYKCSVHCVTKEGKKGKLASLKSNYSLVKEATRNIQKNDIVYAFGIELCGYLKILGLNNRYIYEQADLNYTKLKNNLLVRLFKEVDKYLIKKSFFTALTSQGFVNYLYQSNKCPSQIFLLENRLNNQLKSIAPNPCQTSMENLRFGFVGAIRYPRTILTFAKVIGEKFPNYEFHFYGEGFSSAMAAEMCKQYDNLKYHGRFSNPKDLPSIYNEIDINIVCYDTASMNVRIAEPNKLYESAYFQVPIVVSENTFLEERVKEWGIGYSCDSTSAEKVEQFINSLTLESIERCKQNCRNIEPTKLFDNTVEFIELIISKLNV